LKDKAFSTFLDQNPPFELPPENKIPPSTKACDAVFRDWWPTCSDNLEILEIVSPGNFATNDDD
jgi:hypothetical protein